jgi:hypothetical protein
VFSRIWIAALTVGLMAVGTAGVVAQSGGSNGQSAASSEYKPGLGPCKNDGTNPSGTHTGPPGQPGANCENRPGNSSKSGNAPCQTGTRYVVKVKRPKGTKRLRVTVDGRRVPVRNGRATVPVTGTSRDTIVVSGVTKKGRRVRGQRTFNPCATAADPTVRAKKAKKS